MAATREHVLAAGLLLVCVALLWSAPAQADHSLGRACLNCHSLRSANVLAGSRNIACSNINDALYGYTATCGDNASTLWYCPSVDSTTQWAPGSGQPLDCSYCHDTGGDIGEEIGRATGATVPASFHPVDVRGTAVNIGTIRCNDCHNGDVTPAPGPCDKTAAGDGYPNHILATPLSSQATGNNSRTGLYAHLDSGYKYGTDVDWSGSDWATTSNQPLCFKCHSATGMATSDIETVYRSPLGGHNIVGYGAGGALAARKLPCYDCHDPHASNQNEKLIVGNEDTPRNPYNTSYNSYPPPDTFSASGDDYKVCVTCHDGGRIVEGVTIDDVIGPAILPNPIFPFHAGAHAGVTATSNCLNGYGGCHYDAHDTGLFRCLDCHTKNQPLVTHNQVDSEFGHIGGVLNNGIQSVHSIPYNDIDPAADMSLTANNGCLNCHATQGKAPGTLLVDADGAPYARPSSVTQWEDLEDYNAFCLSCHDGNGVSFTPTADYDLSDPGGGTITYPVGGTALPPPQVNNKAGVADGFYFTSGHGRGQNDAGTLSFSPSGNPEADIPCLECHLYHGSTAFKLLPGDKESTDTLANVVKKTGGATTATQFTFGGLTDSTQLDYRDYTNDTNNSRLATNHDFFSFYLSDYSVNWNSYWGSSWSDTFPKGTATAFGTSGDMRANTKNSNESVANGEKADSAGLTKIGFCNACHFYSHVDDGTENTFGWVYTHEGQVGGSTYGGVPLDSEMSFFKDCAECHDPHGSGEESTTTGADNIYMIRGKIKHAKTTTESQVESSGSWSSNVVYKTVGTETENDNSFDEDDTGANESNADDLCTVCHTVVGEDATYNVDHNYRSYTGAPDHNQSKNCLTCHTHDNNLTSAPGGNIGANGFGRRACTGCHGLPPVSPCDIATGVDDPQNERVENYAGGGAAHKTHVDFLRTKLGVSVGVFDAALCSPCHGSNPGGAPWHLESGSPAAWTWPAANQNNVDLIDGQANFGALATYDGAGASPAAVPATGPGVKGGEPQACANLNCHGPGATVKNLDVTAADPYAAALVAPGALWWDQTCYGGTPTAASRVAGRDNACAGCHASRGGAEPAAAIVVGAYTSSLGSQGATASYYGNPSGYSRGGHGDPTIAAEDPVSDYQAPGDAPLACSVCHNDATTHFGDGGDGNHRLSTTNDPANPPATVNFTALENTADTQGCVRCHATANDITGSFYQHHPSLSSMTQDPGLNPPGAPYFTRVYSEPAGVNYDVVTAEDVDAFVMHWLSTAYTAIAPYPPPAQVNLPRQDDIFSGSAQELVCTTCHNPHGTDLGMDAGSGLGGTYQEIPDNNMLRLRDVDNTLCDACH